MSIVSRMNSNVSVEEFEGLLNLRNELNCGRLIECLDDGFIRLVDKMGNDAAVVQAARVSYGEGTKHVSDDRGLIRYLMRHRHTTPFEMVEFKFHVRIPMDSWRQMVRHRTASINEYSTRYSEAIDSAQKTGVDQWRLQATGNKQGSSGLLEDWPDNYIVEQKDDNESGITAYCVRANTDSDLSPELAGVSLDKPTPGSHLSQQEDFLHHLSRKLYNERLHFGIAREQARKDLPLSTYTEAYWKVDLHNLFHFLGLRMDSHAQQEIREYANAIFKLIQPAVPLCCEAFQDYRLDAMYLSGPDIACVQSGDFSVLSKRERDELRPKLERLGIKVEGL